MNTTSEPPRALSGLPSPLPPTADETAIATATAAAAAAQDVDLAAAAAQLRGSEAAPGRVTKPRARKSPGSGAKRSEPSKRKFICSFSHYGCDVALSSKNEWKRHVSIQHLQLGFYRCDVGSCNPDNNPNTPSHKKVYNDFNRKDLFTQHHRRMHKPEAVAGSNAISNDPNSQDWRAFEDSLEEVRNRCWHEKRKPPQRSTCGFCGRVFEGEGSWNERMEHVGGHYARDLPDACKEEREDEDLTNWALQEGVVKEAVNGRHVLVDQPPSSSERSYLGRGNDITMSDAPPVTGTNGQVVDGQYPIDMELSRRESLGSSAYPPLNGSGRPGSSSGQPFAHVSASGYALSDNGTYQPDGITSAQWSQPHSNSNDSTDRLEDLINRLINPKKPRMSKRLQWRCDCGLDSSVDFAEENPEDQRAFQSLGKISIICKNSQSPLLNTSKTDQYEVIPCDQLASRVQAEGKLATDHGLQKVNEAVAEDGAVLNDAPAPVA